MATWDDVRGVALALPGAVEVSSRGLPRWKVRDLHHLALRRLSGRARPAGLLSREALEELVVEAWADRAPARLVRQHRGDSGPPLSSRRS